MYYYMNGGGAAGSAEVKEALEDCKKATQEAQAAAKACEGIVSGLNTITDDKTEKAYKLGIESGNIYREEI